MKLNIGDKEFSIKFGYKPTLKERLISRIVKMSNANSKKENENEEENENSAEKMEQLEDLLLFLPEILLIGLQVHHEEYRYDYDTKEGKEEQLEKAFDLIDEYSTSENADLMKLFNDFQEEMNSDSFLSRLFQKAEEAEKAEEVVQPKLEMVQTQENSEN